MKIQKDNFFSQQAVRSEKNTPEPTTQNTVDPARRQVLKTFAVAPVALGLGVAGSWAKSADAGTVASSDGPAPAARSHDLELHLFSSDAVVEDSLIIKNNLLHQVVLEQFRPGIIIFNDKFIHLPNLLEKAVGKATLVIEPQQTLSFQTVAEPLYGKDWARSSNLLNNDFVEYLWAEDSVQRIGESALLVSAAAFIADDKALLYSKPQQAVGKSVVPA